MRALRVPRSEADAIRPGLVLARDLRSADEKPGLSKGHVLTGADLPRLRELPWDELHVIEPEVGELHEAAAGRRIADAVAGPGVSVGTLGGGHWPISALHRGLLRVAVEPLARVNAVDGVCVYTRFDGQIVDRTDVVARAKITPLVLPAAQVEAAERIAREARGLVSIAPFQPRVIAVIVQETLEPRAAARFQTSLADKVAWFGSRLLPPAFVPPSADAIATSVEAAGTAGAEIILMAGTKSLDPLDAAFVALDRIGARIDRFGVPAHPGSLFWLAHWRGRPLLGLPTCGLFAQLTTFDLIFPRIVAGERVDAHTLATIGHGGLLSREVSFFPPYPAAPRENG